MTRNNIVEGKYVLIVDDERDVLETLVDVLSLCKVDIAESFEAGKKNLEDREYDIAVLDIMGVQGFRLLELCKAKNIPAIMLTAHALSQDNLRSSFESGASYFVPKDEMAKIETFVADVLEAKEKAKDPWSKWFERLIGFFDKRFSGPDWRDKEREFYRKKIEARISMPEEED